MVDESLYTDYQIDIDLSLEQQGPFDLILHKINDILAKANQGNAQAKARIKNIQVYNF